MANICTSCGQISASYLTDLRREEQHPPGVDVVSVILQVADEAAIRQVLHHQAHAEATWEQANVET